MLKRSIYLSSTPLDKAQELYHEALKDIYTRTRVESVLTKDAYGRVLSEPVYANRSVPFYPSAAMDGLAIDSSKTKGAHEHKPLILNPKDYIEVDTGDPILDPYDCVIMVEDCIQQGDAIAITKAHVPWQNVRPIGEDIVEGELLFAMGHVLRPIDISVLIAANRLEIQVFRKARLALIPTGTEIKSADQDIQLGDIVESNSYMFKGLAMQAQAEVTTFPIVGDDIDALRASLIEAVNSHDVVVINAGSSAGREDYTAQVIQSLGEVYVHGIAIKPGKPAILGRINDVPVIGVPGFPVSAHIIFEAFVLPILYRLNHLPQTPAVQLEATSTRRIVSSLKNKEYIRVKLGYINGHYVATPLSRGAGMMMSIARSDGYALIDLNSEGVEAHQPLTVQINKPESTLQNTLLAVGSHDLILDVLSNLFETSLKTYHLSSVHVGSYAGLIALRQGESSLAMTHLLDVDGRYNHQSVLKLFKPDEVVLVKAVQRIQGLIVLKGNPLNIHTLEDLLRVRFVNRQRGAGTRVLLDYWLQQAQMDPQQITGYTKELSTHLAVAAAVANQSVDCGLGIQAAAEVMGCDFIPLGQEDYDFVLYKKDLTSPMHQHLLDVLRSDAFKRSLEQLGGYSIPQLGEVITYD